MNNNPNISNQKLNGFSWQLVLFWVLVVLATGACGGVATPPTATPLPPTPTPRPSSSDMVVLTTGEWPPFSSETLANKGVFTEVVTAVFNEMAVEPTYEFYPWLRAENAVRNGDAWGAFPYSYNETRAETFAFSDTVLHSETTFFYYKPFTEPIVWETLADLNTYEVGGVLGYFYEDMFNEAQLNVEYASSEELGLRMLQAGRIDFFPLDVLVGQALIQTFFPDEVDNFGKLDKPLSSDPLHVMILKDNPDSVVLLEAFNDTLQLIKEDGTYQEILAKYNLEVDE